MIEHKLHRISDSKRHLAGSCVTILISHSFLKIYGIALLKKIKNQVINDNKMAISIFITELRKVLTSNIHDGSVRNVAKTDLERCLHIMGFYPTPDDLDFLHDHFDTNSKKLECHN